MLNGRFVRSLRYSKSSDNENVHNFLSSSVSFLWQTVVLLCDVLAGENVKLNWRCQNRVRQDIWSIWLQCLSVKQIFSPFSLSYLFFQCHVLATWLRQLCKPYPNKRKWLKCKTVPEIFSSTCFYTKRRSGNKLFKIK